MKRYIVNIINTVIADQPNHSSNNDFFFLVLIGLSPVTEHNNPFFAKYVRAFSQGTFFGSIHSFLVFDGIRITPTAFLYPCVRDPA